MWERGAGLICYLAKVDEGVVNVVGGGVTGEDVVGGVRWGEEGDVCVCELDGGGGVGNIGFVNLIEWGPGEGRGGRRGHLKTVSSNIGRLF